MKRINGLGGYYYKDTDFPEDKLSKEISENSFGKSGNPFNAESFGLSMFDTDSEDGEISFDKKREKHKTGGMVGEETEKKSMGGTVDSRNPDKFLKDGGKSCLSRNIGGTVDEDEDEDENEKLLKKGGKVSIEIKRKGALHEKMGFPEDEKIPLKALRAEKRVAKKTDDENLMKETTFAINARKWKK